MKLDAFNFGEGTRGCRRPNFTLRLRWGAYAVFSVMHPTLSRLRFRRRRYDEPLPRAPAAAALAALFGEPRLVLVALAAHRLVLLLQRLERALELRVVLVELLRVRRQRFELREPALELRFEICDALVRR